MSLIIAVYVHDGIILASDRRLTVSRKITGADGVLQEAVNFARFGIETTENMMQFSDVTQTVGGAIDILAITPEESFWVQKESLR